MGRKTYNREDKKKPYGIPDYDIFTFNFLQTSLRLMLCNVMISSTKEYVVDLCSNPF